MLGMISALVRSYHLKKKDFNPSKDKVHVILFIQSQDFLLRFTSSFLFVDRKFGRVKPGDCVVAFSQKDLYNLRREIEKKSKHKCAIIYGNLPPGNPLHLRYLIMFPESQ